MNRIETNRWRGFLGVVLIVAAVGIVLQEPGLIVAAAVGVGYLAAATADTAPTPDLAVTRTIGADDPEPGDEILITVEIKNESDAALLDLRFVDDVPPGLEVTDGSPRCATALSAGDTLRYSYTVTATRGRHDWTEINTITRDLAGTEEGTIRIDARVRSAARLGGQPPASRVDDTVYWPRSD